MNLYSFYWDCGRMGELEGVFFAEPEDVAEAIGHEIYFGEVLGKHSEIYGTLQENEIKLLSDDQDFLGKVREVLGDSIGSGYNPISYYLEAKECGEYDEDG